MSWLSNAFYKIFGEDRMRRSAAFFMDLITKATKIFLGQVAEDLEKLAKKYVQLAEISGKSGIEKYKYAYDNIRAELDNEDIGKYFINLYIEAAVIALKEGI